MRLHSKRGDPEPPICTPTWRCLRYARRVQIRVIGALLAPGNVVWGCQVS
jgi:hypothetical protein